MSINKPINGENKPNDAEASQDNAIEQLAQIPKASEFENSKVKNRANWFNQNFIYFLAIIGACLGVIIVVLIILL